jgi:ABC-type uncharacterized transport system ATPase subunit
MNNIVSLNAKRNSLNSVVTDEAMAGKSELDFSMSGLNSPANGTKKLSFSEIAAKNAQNAERLRKERLSANKGVLKSYKIK